MVEIFVCLALYTAFITFLVKGVIVYCNHTTAKP